MNVDQMQNVALIMLAVAVVVLGLSFVAHLSVRHDDETTTTSRRRGGVPPTIRP